MKINFLAIAFILFSHTWATGLFTAEIGASSTFEQSSDPDGLDFPEGAHLDFISHYYYGWDQMVLIGLGAGYQQFSEESSVPIVASAIIRLPIGRLFLPAVQGDFGYSFGYQSNFFYRLAGGVDMRLGDRSSLLAFSGVQNFTNGTTGSLYFLRIGLLLEF